MNAEVRLVLGEETFRFRNRTLVPCCLRRLAVVSPLGENAELAATNIEATVRNSLSRETVEHDYAIHHRRISWFHSGKCLANQPCDLPVMSDEL